MDAKEIVGRVFEDKLKKRRRKGIQYYRYARWDDVVSSLRANPLEPLERVEISCLYIKPHKVYDVYFFPRS